MLSSTVRQRKRVGAWNTTPTLSCGSFTGTPAIDTWPADAGIKPATIFRNVVLPHPEGPRIETNSPSSICSEVGCSATRAPVRPA